MVSISSTYKKTVKLVDDAYNYMHEVAENGGIALFVGTKKQAQDAVKDEAIRSGQYYVNHRWLGGTLTNWDTIQTRIKRLKKSKKCKKMALSKYYLKRSWYSIKRIRQT